MIYDYDLCFMFYAEKLTLENCGGIINFGLIFIESNQICTKEPL